MLAALAAPQFSDGLVGPDPGLSRSTRDELGNNVFSDGRVSNVPAARAGTSSNAVITYVLTDLQGSVRAVMNNNGVGTSSVIARHDYLPFGEEIGANVGMRTGAQGYNVPDSNRQKYAMLERDSTGLNQYLVAEV